MKLVRVNYISLYMSRHFCESITFRQDFRYYLIYVLILLPRNWIQFAFSLIDYISSLVFYSVVNLLLFLRCAYISLRRLARITGHMYCLHLLTYKVIFC